MTRRTKRVPSDTYHKHPPFATFDGKRVLNLGCGRSVYAAENVVNLDAFANEGVNVVCDLSKGKLPFESDSFDLIIANHVMEHIPNWFETMKEMARVLKPGGTIEIWIPPISSDAAFGYRDHINYLGISSFFGCQNLGRASGNLAATEEIKELGAFRDLTLADCKCRMIITWWTTIMPEWFITFAASHLRNTVSEEGYFFTKGVRNDNKPS